MDKRSLDELVSPETAWPLILGWIDEAVNEVEVLEAEPAARDRALLALQVTTRSPMGAIAHGSGGLLVDQGWIRILGAGCVRLPRSIPGWNGEVHGLPQGTAPPYLLVADDVLGGFFAIDGGSLGGEPRSVRYFAPDTLRWEDVAGSYSEFLHTMFNADLDVFYGESRWPGYREEVERLAPDEIIAMYPYLWAEGPPVEERHREAFPVAEWWRAQQGMAAQMRAGPPR